MFFTVQVICKRFRVIGGNRHYDPVASGWLKLQRSRHVLYDNACDCWHQTLVGDTRDNVFGFWLVDKRGNGFCGSNFMFVGNFGYAVIQRPAEDSWEGESVINLVWEITAPSSDYGCAGFFSFIRHYFWQGISHSENDWFFVH